MSVKVAFDLGTQELGQLDIQIGDRMLSTGVARFDVGDNRDETVPLEGRLADPGNTPIVDQGPGVRDDVAISCAEGDFDTSPICESLDEDVDAEWQILSLFASSNLGVLTGDGLPQSSGSWNAFEFRELSIRFDDAVGRRVIVGASIGEITIVPEPQASFLLYAASLFLASAKRRNYTGL